MWKTKVQFTYSENFSYEYMPNNKSLIVNVHDIQTHKQKKSGIVVDTKRVVAAYEIMKPDEFGCSYVTIELNREFRKPEVDEMFSVIDMFLSNNTVFIRVPASYMEGINSLSLNLLEKNFYSVGASGDENYFERERPPKAWLPIGMVFGLAVGVLLEAITKRFGLVGVFMALGLLAGALVDAKVHKKRKELRKMREAARA